MMKKGLGVMQDFAAPASSSSKPQEIGEDNEIEERDDWDMELEQGGSEEETDQEV